MSGSLTQFGIGKETTYGTGVTVTKFYEIMSEDLRGNYQRVQAEALSGYYVDRADRFGVAAKGAAGSVQLEPLTKGFASWLAFMLGTNNVTGPTETSVYTHTGILGNLSGKTLTVQVGRADTGGVVRPWTYEGVKVTGFELGNAVDQTLRMTINLDAAKENNPSSPTGIYALQTNVPVVGADVFQWQGATLTYGGSGFEVPEVSLRVDNALNVERFVLGQAGIKKEPTQDGKRSIEFSFRTYYDNRTFWDKVASATAAGSYANLTMKWSGLTLLGTTIYPNITVTIPVARLDEGGPVVAGDGMLEQAITGRALYDGTNSAITIAAQTADTGAVTLS